MCMDRLHDRGHEGLHTLRWIGKRPTKANKDTPERERDRGVQPYYTITGGVKMASVMRRLHSMGLFCILLFCLLAFGFLLL